MTLRLRSRRRLTAAYEQSVVEKRSKFACWSAGGLEWAYARRIARLRFQAFAGAFPEGLPSTLATRRP